VLTLSAAVVIWLITAQSSVYKPKQTAAYKTDGKEETHALAEKHAFQILYLELI